MKKTNWFSNGKILRAVTALSLAAACLSNPAAADPAQPARVETANRPTPAFSDLAVIDERRAIMREMAELTETGASPEEVEAWHQTNAARLEANEQKLAAISAKQDAAPQPYLRDVEIPPGASETLEEFLMERKHLINEEIANANQAASPKTPLQKGPVPVDLKSRDSAAIGELAEKATQLSSEGNTEATTIPTDAEIPQGISDDLRAFIIARNVIIKQEDKISKQQAGSTPEQSGQSVELWRARNPARIQAFQQAAAEVSENSDPSN